MKERRNEPQESIEKQRQCTWEDRCLPRRERWATKELGDEEEVVELDSGTAGGHSRGCSARHEDGTLPPRRDRVSR